MITSRREINLRWITLFLYEWKLFSPLNFPSLRENSPRDSASSYIYAEHLILVTLVCLKATFFRNFRVMHP